MMTIHILRRRATDSTDFADPLYRSLLKAREKTITETIATARLIDPSQR